VNYFVRQDYSRELLFWLFVDSIEVDIPYRKPIGSRYDPPKDYGCNRPEVDPKQRCFADFVHLAIAEGLTIQESTVQTAGSDQGGSSDTSKKTPSKPTTTIYTRLCFNPVLARHAKSEIIESGRSGANLSRLLDLPNAEFTPRCGPWNPLLNSKAPQPDYFPFAVGPVQFRIIPRSAFGVFKFLGKLIKMQLDPPEQQTAYIPPGRPVDEVAAPILWTDINDPYVIKVLQGSGSNCFVHTWFKDADYCVPDDANTTKSIFSLLAQLIAIQTSVTDLSITSLVRVVQ